MTGQLRIGVAARVAARLGLYYGWLVVGVVLLISMVTAGTRMASGILVLPLEAEFGWDRASISLALGMGLLANGLGAPFGGKLVDRFGPQRLILGALILNILATIGTVFMTSVLGLTFWWGIMLGLGTGAMSGAIGAVVANRWFVARRGLVMGLLGGGGSAGQLIFIPVLMDLTVAIEWRAALLLVGILLVALVPLAYFIMRDSPASVGLEAYGAAAASPSAIASGLHSTPLGVALRTTDFWLLAGSYFVCGFTSTGLIGTHFIPHALEDGFTESNAANALAAIGAISVIGTMASGYLTDRFNPRILLAIYYGFRAASLIVLPAVTDLTGLAIFAIVFGLDYIATLPPTAALTADRFGKASLGTILGWIFFSHQVGSAAASWGGGLLRVWLGDYTIAFVAAGIVGLIAAAFCPRIATRVRDEPATVTA